MLEIRVECYAGYRGEETPRRFWMGSREIPILEVRYEDLVLHTEDAMRKVLEFSGEPWDDAVLRFHEQKGGTRDESKFLQNPEATRPIHTSSIGRWRKSMSETDAEQFKVLAGDLLTKLGYETSRDWRPERA